MRDNAKTLAFVVVAVALMGTALIASIPRSRSVEDFLDLGQPFFPEFTDPAACTSLEVVEIDPETALPQPFKVMLKDGRWVIPSHYDYPADAKDRLAQTAARVIGLTKETIRSSRSEDHKALGVLDPLDAKLAGVEGVGKRITLRDRSDRVLADYILGKDVPGRPGRKFVRRPGVARTYGVNIEVEPSTRFADWIEPNLLQAEAAKVRKATFNNTKVDLAQRRIIRGETLEITRPDDKSPWTMPGLAPDQEVDPSKASAMVSAVADLKIVGVRPKPEGLTADLSVNDEKTTERDMQALASLQSKGFYLLQGKFYSDEGDLEVACDDGVVYILRFGKVTFARGEALSAGTGEDTSKDASKTSAKDKDKDNEATVESRFLFVTSRFDPGLVPAPKAAESAGGELPGDVFQRTQAEIKAEAEKAEREKTDHEKRLKDGQARASDLAKRFAPWYYVVPGDAYRSLVLDRKALVHAKGAKSEEPTGLPFGPGGAFPPGGGFAPPGRSPRMPAGHP